METDRRLPTGEWCGFYMEEHHAHRGWMHLYLAFENGQIKGEGTDYVGPWVATGNYDVHDSTCQWTKQYLGKHRVVYRGRCTDAGIQGEWQISFIDGPFHIWPKRMGELNELYLKDELDGGAIDQSLLPQRREKPAPAGRPSVFFNVSSGRFGIGWDRGPDSPGVTDDRCRNAFCWSLNSPTIKNFYQTRTSTKRASHSGSHPLK